MSIKNLSLAALALSTLLACGGGGAATTTGTLTLKLGSDSIFNESQAVVSLDKVEVSTNGSSWTTVASVKATYDLMDLQNGNPATLASDTQIKTGTYTQARLTWSSTNYSDDASSAAYLTLADGTTRKRLSMPTTTTITGSFTVAKDTATSAEIVLAGNPLAEYYATLDPSVNTSASSTSIPYVFQATGSLVDLAECATISGTATYSGTAVADAEVMAETVSNGVATIQRCARTNSSGAFVLEALPIGTTYYLASQPGTSTLAYAPASTTSVAASTAMTYSRSLAFSATSATPGSLSVSITPASSTTQLTWTELRATLLTDSGSYKTLIVRSQMVDHSSSLTKDAQGFSGLYPTSFGVMAQRKTSSATTTATTNDITIAAGSQSTTLTF